MRKKLFLTSAAVLWAVTAMNSAHAATDVQKLSMKPMSNLNMS